MRSFAFAAVAIASLSFAAIAPAAERPTLNEPSPAAKPVGSYEVAQACGWYAIFECAKNPRVGGPGRLIDTSDYPNFRPGWYCRVMGPFGSRGQALRRANSFGGYVKSAC